MRRCAMLGDTTTAQHSAAPSVWYCKRPQDKPRRQAPQQGTNGGLGSLDSWFNRPLRTIFFRSPC